MRSRTVVAALLLAVPLLGGCRVGLGQGSASALPSAESLQPPTSSPSPIASATPSASARPIHLDAKDYAEAFGVSLEEASRRLYIQGDMEPLEIALHESLGDRFAGAWLEHEPVFRYVVRVTGDAPIALNEAEWPLPLDVIYGSAHSYRELVAASRLIPDRLAEMYSAMTGVGVDVQTNSIVLYGTESPSHDLVADLEELLGVTVTFEEMGPATRD